MVIHLTKNTQKRSIHLGAHVTILPEKPELVGCFNPVEKKNNEIESFPSEIKA